MPPNGSAKFNPFILGQIALLLGVSAVVVLMIPLVRSHRYFRNFTVEHESTSDTEGEIIRFHNYAMPVALVGLGFGIIGIRREKPPLGGDPIQGTSFKDTLALFEEDNQTQGIVMIGEIGGSAEEEAAEFAQSNLSKPVVAFIAGQSAPVGKRMGHAGAIISGGKGTAQEKKKTLNQYGIATAETPADIGKLAKQVFKL